MKNWRITDSPQWNLTWWGHFLTSGYQPYPYAGKQPSSLLRTHSTTHPRTPAVCSAGKPVSFWDFLSQDNGFWNRYTVSQRLKGGCSKLEAFKLRPQTNNFQNPVRKPLMGSYIWQYQNVHLTSGQPLRLHTLFQTWKKGRSLPLACLE